MDHTKLKYIGLGLFVTLLWASSFVIIKKTLDYTTPLAFAGYRYLVASILLLFILLSRTEERSQLVTMPTSWWIILTIYGTVFIFLTQGAGYLTLTKLPAITLSFTLNFSTVLVVVLGFLLLNERTSWAQNIFILISIIGAMIYFYPLDLSDNSVLGYIYLLVALGANSVSTVLGRSINKKLIYSPLVITTVSMIVGTSLLLTSGLVFEGYQPLSMDVLIAVLWLGIINTALAFTLWNKSMQYLEAFEASIILNTMLPQIVILSILFLDELPTTQEWIGLGIIVVSVSIVQYLSVRGQKQRQFDPTSEPN